MFYWSSISSDFVINIQKSFIFVLADSLIFLPFLLDTFQKIFFISHIYFYIHVSSFRIVFPYFVKLHSITRTVIPPPRGSLKWAKNLLRSLLCQMVFVVQKIMLYLYTFIKLIWNMYYQKVIKLQCNLASYFEIDKNIT